MFYRETRPISRTNHTMKRKPTVKYGQSTAKYGQQQNIETLTDYFGTTNRNNHPQLNPPGGGAMWNVEVKPFHID